MSRLTRWQAKTDPDNLTGTATFTVGGRVLAINLASFADAQAIDELIDYAALQAKTNARKAAADYLRGAAATMLDAG